jgi:hypothetical protein
MELPLTPSISRRFFGLTIPSDDMLHSKTNLILGGFIQSTLGA